MVPMSSNSLKIHRIAMAGKVSLNRNGGTLNGERGIGSFSVPQVWGLVSGCDVCELIIIAAFELFIQRAASNPTCPQSTWVPNPAGLLSPD